MRFNSTDHKLSSTSHRHRITQPTQPVKSALKMAKLRRHARTTIDADLVCNEREPINRCTRFGRAKFDPHTSQKERMRDVNRNWIDEHHAVEVEVAAKYTNSVARDFKGGFVAAVVDVRVCHHTGSTVQDDAAQSAEDYDIREPVILSIDLHCNPGQV